MPDETQFPVVGGQDPWHMWGGETTFTTQGNIPGSTLLEPTTVQLAKVNYGRPDTWRFVLFLKFPAGIADLVVMSVDFVVIVGVGRTSVTLDPFDSFTVVGAVAPNVMIWHSTVRQPNPGSATLGDATDQIVAQDIQCYANVNSNLPAIVTIGAMFAPNVHVRPDWFVGKFSGELGGT